ncbi:type II secretion system major pseudopilin GspG [Yersinia intermedia]|jgi:general secretion pathway protein G|uniref:Type II secretion system core protein G n=1 Tax=Yersinia intermedia TaxID=631 RepID=A0A208ZJY0_YERIN|nr:type II secretion system major pseudopilin GspG [Yersinia intermedia]MCB5323631.1 type II secretion system major pseudopilin GspG [Yersinia intermedia]OVZ80798.1 type II secretion system protein GspG [Yersinia intermedia]UNK24221.1 type II secretion system major pseudopilin GspG [Yersinia intermedia]UZM71823.1 type II secretion system major pseudopilin GspG [Yersinia intermedia]WET16126.1 type II secretion system major pseudopilin GspG [Yersinia intermedia]
MKDTKSYGFTLLEIMVVIMILGVLASLTVPSLMSNKNRADRQKTLSDIVALENALDMYKLDNGRYPTELQGINSLVIKPTELPIPRVYPHNGYIRRLPQDPWGSAYQMNNPGKNGDIDIFSAGPDREIGNDDDIGNWTISS